MSELDAQTALELPRELKLPSGVFLFTPGLAERHWTYLGSILERYEKLSVMVHTSDTRIALARGTKQLFGLRCNEELALALTCVVPTHRGALSATGLMLPASIDDGSIERLLGAVELFARRQNCVALDIYSLGFEHRIAGRRVATIVERDLTIPVRPN